MANLTSLNGNSQKLDGGAMFGHVPKDLWSQWHEADSHNRILLSTRALLIQDGNKNILLETGIGSFFSPKLKERYGVIEDNHVLLDALKQLGLSENDIDFVILSHLHFDHAGGLLTSWQQDKSQSLLFNNAKYLISKLGWERACNPHYRDKASFIPELNELLAKSNRLHLIDKERSDLLGEKYRFIYTEGHTPGLMHTIFKENDECIIFASDLIPGLSWVHLPVVMGYDRAPETLINEKKEMLELAIKKNALLFYTHDIHSAASRICQDEKGKYITRDVLETLNSYQL